MRATREEGFLAIIVVVLVGSFLLVASMSLLLLHGDEVNSASNWLSEVRSRNRAESCVGNVMALLRNNINLSGNININTANVPCTAVISSSGNMRTIVARATSTDAFNRNAPVGMTVNVNANTNPFTVTRYQDILE